MARPTLPAFSVAPITATARGAKIASRGRHRSEESAWAWFCDISVGPLMKVEPENRYAWTNRYCRRS